MQPETRYAESGDLRIAWQAVGEGPLDLVVVPGFVSNVDFQWIDPDWARGLRRLASFSRLILFDKRGTGLSDPTPTVPTLEERMDDVRAVMDAAGSERAALFGYSEGGPMSALFAATYPERVQSLVLLGTFTRMATEPGSCPWWEKNRATFEIISETVEHWGEGRILGLGAPSTSQNQLARRLAGVFERASASPAMARALITGCLSIDVTDILPAIRVPTLVISRTGDRLVPVENSRDTAERIPGARFVELPGDDHFWWVGDTDRLVDEVEGFLTGSRHAHTGERVLATVLFTDIVASTERAAAVGDRAWREVLDRHDSLLRREVAEARGRVLKSMGDGYLATFDGPARAIECARAIVDGSRDLGLDVRAGVHTGECDALGDDVGGMAVNIGARVGAAAGPGEVLVSSTVKDLVVGSGLHFTDRGERALKGVPGEWRLFAVGDGGGAPPQVPAERPPLGTRAMIAMARRSPKTASRMVRLARGRRDHTAPVEA